MHTFSIAFPLYVSILLRSLRIVVVIFLPILFCVISSSAVAAASALLYLHLRLSLCLFVLWKVQVFPVACGLWSLSTSSVKCRNASVLSTEMSVYVCMCMCVYVVRLYVCFIFVAIAFFCFGVRFSFRRCHRPHHQRRCQSSSQVSHSADSFCLAETFCPAALMFTYLLFCFCL